MSDLFEPIAVVGISARFPGAPDAASYWRNLSEGRETISDLSDEELAAVGVPARLIADPSYVKRAGLVPGADLFDAAFFAMTPREAEVCDPQLRLFLEVAFGAIEDAGCDPDTIGREIAVFGACGPNEYGNQNVMANPRYSASPDMGLNVLNNIDYLATLVSYKLDLRGPSMAVQSACSSSLSAVHLACRSLQVGECDAAVAGAAKVSIPYRVGYRWSPGSVYSADGRCRALDAAATGTIFTSGAAAVLLKRLGDAIADGDHVWGVVHGIGVNNDGSDKVSFSAPSASGQVTAVVDAMTVAGFDPTDIAYVEMHATGTPLGDPVEMSALTRAYRRLAGDSLPSGRIPVGSVKSNIGHTDQTGGMAGLLKLLLALENEQLPPTINVTAPNPKLEIESTPFRIDTTPRPWPRTPGVPRRAGLTSLGIGGTNVHLVLQEGPVADLGRHEARPRIVVWSGRDDVSRAANRAALADWFATAEPAAFAHATATLQSGRAAYRARGAAVCSSAEEAAELLAGRGDVLTGGQVVGEPPPVVFTFPGQGAQRPRMAAGLYGRLRAFTEAVDVCLDAAARQGADVHPLWLAGDPGQEIDETANVQPLLFAVEYALARQWTEWGVRPAGLIGHSLGELVAAAVADVLDVEDAVRLVVLRGRAMQGRPRGSMLVAAAGVQQVRAVLPEGSGVAVAAVNAADQTVLAGGTDDVAAVGAALTAAGVASRLLPTSHAFHSPAMLPAVEEFRAGFDGVRLRPPAIPVYSAATGALLTEEQATDPGFWAGQLVEPVLFADAVESATQGRVGVLLEVGPGAGLTGLTRRHPSAQQGPWTALPSLPRPGDDADTDERSLLTALAELWLTGVPVAWDRLTLGEGLRRVPLPGYQLQRSRYWVEPAATDPPATDADPAPAVDRAARTHPGAGPGDVPAEPSAPAAAGPFSVPSWAEAQRPPVAPAADGTQAVALALVPDDEESRLSVVSALQQVGHLVVRLRPGPALVERGGEFTVRPQRLAEDLDIVLERLAARGRTPSVLVHAWGADPSPAEPDEDLGRTFFALLALVQRAGRRPVAGRLPAVFVITTAAVDVSGSEPLVAARAALVAAARSFGLESPGTVCRVVDVGASCPEDELAAELACPSADPVVALRGTRRWLPVRRPWSASSRAPDLLRRNGVYLLTGGLGGLGLAVAKGLAGSGRRPRLLLLSRGAHEVDDDLAELESLGAVVRTARCDVADAAELERVLDEVTAELGPLQGVFHLAGVAGDGMLQFREPADAREVLHPKVSGTTALADVLSRRPPVDFVTCFSSRAALTGMVGGADYAAANAFLDAYCAGRPGWRSINWPGWSSVGMARGGVLDAVAAAMRAATEGGPPAEAAPTAQEWTTVLSADTHWELDEHRIGGAAIMPGTGQVDLVLRAYLETFPGAAAPLTLEEVVFLRPLAGDVPQEVRICFEPAAADGSRRVRVLSRDDGPAAPARGWRENTSCVLVPGGPPRRVVPLEELTADLLDVPPLSARQSREDAYVFGPHWENTDQMRTGDGVVVARLSLPDAFAHEVHTYAVHPALMDTAVGAHRDFAPDGLVVPFMYRRMTWYGPLPDRLFSRARVSGDDPTADIDLVAVDGSVVVAIEGFRVRAARLGDFGAQARPPDGASDAGRNGVSSGAAHGAAGDAAGGTAASGPAHGAGDPPRTVQGDDSGLPPDEGVRLLLQLLTTSTPAQVAVAPHDRDGTPVADPATTATPPVVAAPPQPATAAAPASSETQGAPGPAVTAGPAAGTATVQDRLAALWQQVLGYPSVAPDDDFFDLGGDSLMAVALTGRIRDTFGVELSIGSLFDAPTPASLATVLVQQGAR